MAETVLGNVIEFFQELGVYDVLLPFLLVFTIMFAILEKTKVLGTEKVGNNELTKKNLNAMVSFVIAFLVVASAQLVGIITEISAELIVLLLLIVFFLMLIGTFYTKKDIDEKGITLSDPWKTSFMVFIAVCLLLIFADAIKTSDGDTWLEIGWSWFLSASTDTGVAAIVLIIILIIFVSFAISEPKGSDKKGGSK